MDAGAACHWIARAGLCDQRVQWLPRPAMTNDLGVAYRVLLQTSPDTFSQNTAAEMSVQGLGSYYIAALTQMRARKSYRECVGRWCLGLAVPDNNDATEGTAELTVRKRVADAVKNGWRLSQPADEGSSVGVPSNSGLHATCQERPQRRFRMPNPIPRSSGLPSTAKLGEEHVYAGPGERLLCKRFKCGTLERCSATAMFCRWNQCPDMEPCSVCKSRARLFLEGILATQLQNVSMGEVEYHKIP